MLKKIKEWAYSFLSTYIKDSLLADLHAEEEKNKLLCRKIESLNYYIDGLEYGIKSMRKIQIQIGQTGEVKEK